MRYFLTLLTILSTAGFATVAAAQGPSHRSRGYDALDAGWEAYQRQEQDRRFRVERQRWFNDEMVFWSRSYPAWRYEAEPWPFLPGDIYGYPLAEPPVRQPVDQIEEQIGPNTWFSRPVYSDDWDLEAEAEVFGPREF